MMKKKTTFFLTIAAFSLFGSAFANEETTNGPDARSRAETVAPTDPGTGPRSAVNAAKKSSHRRVKRAKRSAGFTEGIPTPDSSGATKQQAAPVGNNHP